ncbi:hypothetical protein EG68_10666, partial [Paragonimus skrjabini miyazakii]
TTYVCGSHLLKCTVGTKAKLTSSVSDACSYLHVQRATANTEQIVVCLSTKDLVDFQTVIILDASGRSINDCPKRSESYYQNVPGVSGLRNLDMQVRPHHRRVLSSGTTSSPYRFTGVLCHIEFSTTDHMNNCLISSSTFYTVPFSSRTHTFACIIGRVRSRRGEPIRRVKQIYGS